MPPKDQDPGADRLLRLLIATAAGGLGGPAGALTGFLGAGLNEIVGLIFDPDTRQRADTALQHLDEPSEALYLRHALDTRALAALDFDPARAADELLRRAREAGEPVDDAMRQPLHATFAALCTGPELQSAFREQIGGRLNQLDERLKILLTPQQLLRIPHPATPLARAARIAPSNLLRADYEVVPYEPRPAFEAELKAWCDGPNEGGDDYPKLRLYTAPGGAGKSRFFIQWCRALPGHWRAGFLHAHPQADFTHLARDHRPLFVVVDYADGRNDEVTRLLATLQRHAGTRRVRIILLARNAGPWIDHYALSDPDARELFTQESPKELPPLGHDEPARPALFLRAFAAFKGHAERFQRRPEAIGEPTLPDFTGEGLDNALLIHTAAYLAVAGDTVPGGDAGRLFRRVMEHEQRHWGRIRPAELSEERMLEALGDLTALTTLAGGIAGEALHGWLERAPAPLDAVTRPLIAQRLRQLYPADGNVAPLLPDRLGEWWVDTRLAARPDLLPAAFAADTDDPALVNGLTVLARIAKWNREHGERWLTLALARDFPRLAPPALEIAVTEWDGLGRLLHRHLREHPDPATAGRLGTILDDRYWHTLALRELAEEATRQRLDAVGGEDEAALAEKAGHLNNASARLYDLGRREEALDAAREAAEIRRQLAEARPDAFRPNLAMSLNNLANCLSDLGRREEALDAAREAVEIRRQLAAARPDAFRPDLAGSLNNLANSLSDLGRREEALDAAREAADLYRQLAETQPDAFRPDLAMSLNNLATFLSNLGRREEAFDAAREAVEIRRQLAAARPDAFRPNLAMSLNNLATFLSRLGQQEKALDAAREAADLYRQLAAARPDAFRPDLAMSLNNLASSLSDLGRREEALDAAREAADLYRQLAEARPDAFRPDLATSLNNLATFLSGPGRREEALDTAREAVEIRRQLAAARPDAFTADLCQSLGVLGSAIAADGGGHEEALAAFAEGIERLTPYLQRLPAAFVPLMRVLVSLYREQCERLEREPDAALLGPAAEVFQRLSAASESEA
ncbi:tetratricopeptide repeat protein [Endothiovibrio diazotrophicus]